MDQASFAHALLRGDCAVGALGRLECFRAW